MDEQRPGRGRRETENEGGQPPSWVDVIDDVLDEHVGRDEALELRAEDLTVDVPLSMAADAGNARWGFDGTVRINVKGAHGPLAGWLRLWYTLRRQETRREEVFDGEELFADDD